MTLCCPCADCGINTLPQHWYMVTDTVWNQAALGHGYLCLDCIEIRLSRRLSPQDLAALPINYPGVFRDNNRLHALKTLFAANLNDKGGVA